MKNRWLIILLALIISNSLNAATITMYVDQGNGGAAVDYDTVAKAAAAIQDAIDHIVTLTTLNLTDNGGDNVIIYVLNGTYQETIDTTPGGAFTTSAAYDIVIRNYPGHSPLILNRLVTLGSPFITFLGFVVDGGAGGTGININTTDCKVLYNEVMNVGNNAADEGIADPNGNQRNQIIGNRCHDNAKGIRVRGDYTVCRSNVCYDNVNGGGIRHGTTGRWCVISHNLLYNNDTAGISLVQADNAWIFNNICYGNDDGINLGGSSGGHKIFNNTFFKNNIDGIYLSTDTKTVSFFNNLCVSNVQDGIQTAGGTTYTADRNNNNSYGNGGVDYNNYAPAGNDISLDPVFVSTASGNADFMKLSFTTSMSSPCIDRGLNAGSYPMSNDFWSQTRPYDHPNVANGSSIYDIGADECYMLPGIPLIVMNKQKDSPVGNPGQGDFITYRIDYTNKGGLATGVTISDLIPDGAVYLAGSMTDPGALSDSAGNDEAYFDGSKVFYAPNGVAPGTPGTLASNESGSFYFTVQVVSVGGGSTTNSMDITYTDSTLDRSIDGPASWNAENLGANPLKIQDFGNDDEFRAMIGVDISGIPGGVTITAATQFLYLNGSTGGSAANLNPYMIDYITITKAGISAGPGVGNWSGGVIQPWFASYNYPGGTGYWIYYPVTGVLQNAVTNTSLLIPNTFQQRIRPTPDLDNNTEGIRLRPANDGSNPPYLRVYYILDSPVIWPASVTNKANLSGFNFTVTSSTLVTLISNGAAPSNTTLSIEKSILSIELDGVGIQEPVPGSTITYQVHYSNQGPDTADNMIIYDVLPADVVYYSITSGTWTAQYSYSSPPDQAWGSGNYANVPPGIPANVRWVRWTNPSVTPNQAGTFTYQVIVK